MIDLLDRKIRQMHAALDGLTSDDLSVIKPKFGHFNGGFYSRVDFNEGTNEAELANVASLLVANIACMKDHLKVWCKKHGSIFEGDKLINKNRSVALVHDLWNVDKHAELKDAPRSGQYPRLRGLRRTLVISAGTAAGAGAFFSMDPRTGKVTTGSSGGGSVQLTLEAQVVDENGNILGQFTEICEQATEAWCHAFTDAGVPLP